MKNTIYDLQDSICETVRILSNIDLKGDDLKVEIDKAIALNNMANTAIENAKLLLKALKATGAIA